jgi:hypothetical protein
VTAGRSRLLLFLLTLFCSTYFFPRWADVNVNSRLDMVFAIVHDGTLRIDRYVRNTVDYAMVDGHYYSDKAPGAALLGVPLYAPFSLLMDTSLVRSMTDRLADHAAFQATLRVDGSGVHAEKIRFAVAQVWLSFMLAAVPTALLCVLMHSYLSSHGAGDLAAFTVPLLYALASPAFAYANAFYGHQLAAFLLFAAFMIVQRPPEPNGGQRTASFFLAGVLLGGAVLTEYPALIVASIIFLYAAWQSVEMRHVRALCALSTGGALCALILTAYNTLVFGGPFQFGYSHSTLWTTQHATGLFSLSWPQPPVAGELTFGVFRGLFLLSPVLLLAVPGFVLWLRSGERRRHAWVSLAAIGGMLSFNASSVMWWGGWSVGPRYMLPGLPFFVLALPFVMRIAYGTRLTALLGVISVVATWSMTIAGQSFPSDALSNPWVEHMLPSWLVGDIARSWGTLLGLRGYYSLVPPVLLTGMTLGIWRCMAVRAHCS